jgi:glutathione peroxidase
MNTIYDYSALEFSGQEKSLKDYSGKVILIVNTASLCYFRRQFKSLEQLYQRYKDQGFEILAFPSNNFMRQEPRTGVNLETYCRLKEQVTFPIFRRIHVRGEFAHPLYRYLSSKKLNGKVDSIPICNFHKYLIDKRGQVVNFYYPFTSPKASRLKMQIEQLLGE